ncbi:SRPBCC family protein [Streptomyces sp. NPDC051310]|uniref:SRPBCC family protein n=1 Tax=Streptomyces sp. NPDC051310 TaxID=3365649 RepID=UPI0037ACA35A
MRYADGPLVECDVHVEAPPQAVWELVTDIQLPARLSPELQRAEWTDAATRAPALGETFVGYNRHPLVGEWRTMSRVVELQEQRVFGWAVVDPDGRFGDDAPDFARPMATWRFTLSPEAGGTRLHQSARLGPARSGVSLSIDRMPDREAQIVSSRLKELRANIEASLRGIKVLAEADER